MNVERVEHHHVAAPALCDLLCRGMRQRVGAPDHERLEGEARIEGRTPERIVGCRDRPHRMAPVAAVELDLAQLTLRREALRLFDFRRQGPNHRRAHAQLDARKGRLFGLPAGQHPFGVVRLDPALEEAGRHRQMRGVDLDPLKIHAGEPALENILTDLGAKTILHAGPAVHIHARHCVSLLDRRKTDGERGRNAILRREVAPRRERRSGEYCGAGAGPEGELRRTRCR